MGVDFSNRRRNGNTERQTSRIIAVYIICGLPRPLQPLIYFTKPIFTIKQSLTHLLSIP